LPSQTTKKKKFATVTTAKKYQWSCTYSDRRPYKLNWLFKSRQSFLTRYIWHNPGDEFLSKRGQNNADAVTKSSNTAGVVRRDFQYDQSESRQRRAHQSRRYYEHYYGEMPVTSCVRSCQRVDGGSHASCKKIITEFVTHSEQRWRRSTVGWVVSRTPRSTLPIFVQTFLIMTTLTRPLLTAQSEIIAITNPVTIMTPNGMAVQIPRSPMCSFNTSLRYTRRWPIRYTYIKMYAPMITDKDHTSSVHRIRQIGMFLFL
jgi:hypothetical protein